MSESAQYKGATDFVRVDAANPLPVVQSTPSGDQPAIFEESLITSTTPLPVVIS